MSVWAWRWEPALSPAGLVCLAGPGPSCRLALCLLPSGRSSPPTAVPGHLLLSQGLLASFIDPAASFLPLWPFQGGFWARSWQAVQISFLSGAGTRPVWLQCLTLLQSQHRLMHERRLWGSVGAASAGGNQASKGLRVCGLLGLYLLLPYKCV